MAKNVYKGIQKGLLPRIKTEYIQIRCVCGIGVVHGRGIKDGKSIIKKSLEAIPHRGNSLFEIAVLPDCVLGANRLEIVDAQKARQPQTNEDGTVFVVFNGEIFNFRSLRLELAGKGHSFATESDTEVLVHLWEEYGAGMVKMLDSEMFAFVIYDKKTGALFAARDPYGVKPLYYAVDSSGNLHFASEIKQLAQFGQIDRIMEFPPGHHMLGRELAAYHAIPEPGDVTKESTQEIILKLRRLFDDAVRKRVDTDLPVGVLFSGGLDSAAVLATARKFNRNVSAITMGHRESPDRIIAQKYCDESGIGLIAGDSPTKEELAPRVSEFIKMAESYEPRIINHAASYESIANLARKNGFRVVLCGEGADELLGGYDSFWQVSGEDALSRLFYSFVFNLPRTQFQRLDRSTMAHTVEARAPFFDTRFADYVMRIPAGLKVNRGKGYSSMKWIFREAMKDRLPAYIVERKKMPLHRGPGLDGNRDRKEFLRASLKGMMPPRKVAEMRARHPGWIIRDDLEACTFGVFAELGYAKADFNRERTYSFLPRLSLWGKIRFWPLKMIQAPFERLRIAQMRGGM
jgi:asparagine synthase (glutamine-hydrolysing)